MGPGLICTTWPRTSNSAHFSTRTLASSRRASSRTVCGPSPALSSVLGGSLKPLTVLGRDGQRCAASASARLVYGDLARCKLGGARRRGRERGALVRTAFPDPFPAPFPDQGLATGEMGGCPACAAGAAGVGDIEARRGVTCCAAGRDAAGCAGWACPVGSAFPDAGAALRDDRNLVENFVFGCGDGSRRICRDLVDRVCFARVRRDGRRSERRGRGAGRAFRRAGRRGRWVGRVANPVANWSRFLLPRTRRSCASGLRRGVQPFLSAVEAPVAPALAPSRHSQSPAVGELFAECVEADGEAKYMPATARPPATTQAPCTLR